MTGLHHLALAVLAVVAVGIVACPVVFASRLDGEARWLLVGAYACGLVLEAAGWGALLLLMRG